MEGRHILIADGEAAFADILSALLTADGATIARAGDAAALFARLAAGPVDIVLLDGRLPGGGDGFILCEKLRDAACCGVVLMTPRGRPTDREKGLALGADAVLTKPFSMDALTDAIRRLPQRGRKAAP